MMPIFLVFSKETCLGIEKNPPNKLPEIKNKILLGICNRNAKIQNLKT